MEVWVMAYAKSSVIKAVKNAVDQSREIQTIVEKIIETRERYQAISAQYDREVHGMKLRTKGEKEFKDKLEETNKRADAELDPILAEISKLQKTIDELEIKLFAEYLPRNVTDEISEIRKILEDLNMKNVKNEKPAQRGKLGLAGVLNVHIETDKTLFKELKNRLDGTRFNKLDVIVETH